MKIACPSCSKLGLIMLICGFMLVLLSKNTIVRIIGVVIFVVTKLSGGQRINDT